MLYQVNNKAQAVGIADYSVDNFLKLSVSETLCTMKMSNLMGTQWVTLAHAIPIGDDNGIWLLYLQALQNFYDNAVRRSGKINSRYTQM